LSATTNIRNLFGMLGGATGFDSADIFNLYGAHNRGQTTVFSPELI
jgi:hypothetical protein